MLKTKNCLARFVFQSRYYSKQRAIKPELITVNHKQYEVDNWTTITPRIQSYMSENIYLQKDHPLSILRKEIIGYFYKAFVNGRGNPLFSVYENLDPIVTPKQNFDDLLVPCDHVSRKKSDSYYLNKNYMLRAHTTAHQVDNIFNFHKQIVSKIKSFELNPSGGPIKIRTGQLFNCRRGLSS